MDKIRLKIRDIGLLLLVSMFLTVVANAGAVDGDEDAQNSGKRHALLPELDRAVLMPADGEDDQGQQRSNVWLRHSYFLPAMDVFSYSDNTKTSSKLTQWRSLQLGWNGQVSEHWRLRWSAVIGDQRGTRATEPKSVHSTYWGSALGAQWQTEPTEGIRLALLAGYNFHRSPEVGVEKLQKGSILATAAPGQTLFRSSAEDTGWALGGMASIDIGASLIWHNRLEYRQARVQASTVSYDPLIHSLLEQQQVPQANPWQEKRMVVGMGLDWAFADKVALAMDIRHDMIRRLDYIPRTKFVDYNQNTQLNLYLNYAATSNMLVFLQAQASTHFLLSEQPSLYNRRNNHTFKHPFGFLALGVQYAL